MTQGLANFVQHAIDWLAYDPWMPGIPFTVCVRYIISWLTDFVDDQEGSTCWWTVRVQTCWILQYSIEDILLQYIHGTTGAAPYA